MGKYSAQLTSRICHTAEMMTKHNGLMLFLLRIQVVNAKEKQVLFHYPRATKCTQASSRNFSQLPLTYLTTHQDSGHLHSSYHIFSLGSLICTITLAL